MEKQHYNFGHARADNDETGSTQVGPLSGFLYHHGDPPLDGVRRGSPDVRRARRLVTRPPGLDPAPKRQAPPHRLALLFVAIRLERARKVRGGAPAGMRELRMGARNARLPEVAP